MYEAFYGLKERPFNLTPDPRYLYLSEKHKEAFAHLLYGIKHRAGFVMVTGEIGTGKTTICRTLLNQLDPDTEVAFIFNPSLSPVELLKKINEDFGIESRAKTVKDLIDELNDYLLDSNARGKNCVLVIDEAQNLTPSVLEQIRLLSNLESETQKLLQIVLIGQPELGEHLELRELRQLKQRISARYHLKPLDNKETSQYVTYRLRVAGAHRRIRFSPSALRVIFAHSKGTPRVINSLCDRALLIGYTQEASEISKEIAHRAAKELRGEPVKKRRDFSFLRQMIPNPTIVALAILAMIAGKYLIDNFDQITAPRPPESGAVSQSANVAETRTEPISFSPPIVEAAPVMFAPKLPPAVTPEIPEEPEPLTFGELLDEMDTDAARNEAARAILRSWEVESPEALPETDDVEGLINFAEANGFTGEALAPSLSQLTAINLPAFVRVSHGDRQMWLGIVGSSEDGIEVTTGENETMDVPTFDFMERYLAEAVILWKDPQPDAPILHQDMNGEPVRILQSQLKHLGLLDGRPTGYFGTHTTKAVADLQKETGLNPDGIAGRMTRMVLASWLPGFETPALNPDSKRIVATLDQTGQPAAPPKVVSALEPEGTDDTESLAELSAESAPDAVADEPEPIVDPPQPIEVEAKAEIDAPAVETPAPTPEAAKPIAEAVVSEPSQDDTADVLPEAEMKAPSVEPVAAAPVTPTPAAQRPKEPKPAPKSEEALGKGGPEIPIESFHDWFESVGPPVTATEVGQTEQPVASTSGNDLAATPAKKTDKNEGPFEATSIMPLVPHEAEVAKNTGSDTEAKKPADSE